MPPQTSSRGGFSLVELLVSMLILGLMMAMIGAVLQGIANSTSLTQGHVTADAEAGLVFGRMGRDLSAMPDRNDIDSVFYKSPTANGVPGNDSMYFYTGNPAPPVTNTPLSNLSLVGYQVVAPADVQTLTNLGLQPYSLVRRVQALALSPTSTTPSLPFYTYSNPTNFNNNDALASPTFLSFVPNANSTIAGIWTGILPVPPAGTAGTASDYHLLGEGVFRMEICYLLKQQTYPGETQPLTGGYSNVPTYSVAQLQASYPAASSAQQPTVTLAANMAQTPSSNTAAYPQSRYYDTTYQRVYVCQSNWDATHSPTGAAQTIWTPAGMRDVSAIVVGLAIIDPLGRARMTSAQLGTLASGLTDSDNTNKTTIPSVTSANASPPLDLMGYQWTQDLPGAIAAASLPPNFIRFVHIYQHTFYLNSSNLPYEVIP